VGKEGRSSAVRGWQTPAGARLWRAEGGRLGPFPESSFIPASLATAACGGPLGPS